MLPVTFRITNYKEMKEKKESWRSPYFYTHAHGYKMRLIVEVNSDTDDAKNHLSLYCHIALGVHDNSLAWPFPGEITLQILNQSRDSGHHSENLDWNGADSAGKPKKGENYGWGYPSFISHTDLEKEGKAYLKNDCIYIRVLKVSFSKQWLVCSVIPSNKEI